MRKYERSSGRGRKPTGTFGGGFGADRPRGRYGGSSNRNSSEGRFSRDDDRSSRRSTEAHEVVCDKCGRETTVPFKPTGNKPVYCRDCFNKKDDSFEKSRPESRERDNHSSNDLAKINQKLDKIMRALEIE